MAKKNKLKIKKSVAKRFKVTKTGKVLFRGSHIRHLRRKKSKSNLRRQKVPQRLRGVMAQKVKRALGKSIKTKIK
ncbi:50S ribosomal protein L35 [Candidatus Shapirobacteria bacterium CG10_big_fil_rev_8_21_14_0_10_48_15]|uniref:Large ribosomal subunit protein bL35 n=1 Tax=Candidatus Shapirobacteria bacterium CG10_big_fil_rev_8_21_14_0_10_48_15 TaxID=1974484 RepID=A0A2M8L7A2_9BACT|nr:MAG: 50S ribosomal protein L35 [Candidatus Shapirobacteria bacterium CG10_big_fil_rev_8_21_14_0_10_48_15]